ncbi:MAG: hypothetical protein A3F69_00170 [Acidobacteria bacterium RIFCSPLOWO2_12_FULL_66_10]|nr:MAG: hypothetical protein A3F69_00170 [Acidobacteria bacterium RIFCSPLOWO2_12_FULL_66_10]
MSVAASADTLVLRDGRRVEGELIGFRDGMIEFDGQRRFGGRERLRIDREDVLRIELEDHRGAREGADRERGDRDRGRGDADDNQRPSGLRERDTSVDSWVAWKDSGVEVRAGQTLYFSATGRVRWGPGRQNGPSGERNSPRNDGRPMPSRPAAALIGRIGESRDGFFIGDETGPIRMPASGRLFLGINDDYLQDNTGSFSVTIFF